MSEDCCHHEGHNHGHPSQARGLGPVVLSLILASVSMILAMPHMFGMSPSIFMAAASGVLSLAVVGLFGLHFLKAIPLLFHRANMNTLIGLGILASFGLSAWNISHDELDKIYFDSAAFIAAFVILGQFIESKIRERMNRHTAQLIRLLPDRARKLVDGVESLVAPSDLKIGDRIKVLTGERVPVDSKIISAEGSQFDEAVLTGESKPVDRKGGAIAIQAALVLGRALELEVLRSSKDSLYEQLVNQVQQTLAQKPALQKKIDRIAAVFVPLVVLLAGVTAWYWHMKFSDSQLFVTTSIAVLVIACPCAMGLATPTALLVGVVRAARRGILIKSLEATDQVSGITTIAFDKTGTLTEGRPTVKAMKAVENLSHKDLIQLALTVERDSNHPYAVAIRERAKEDHVSALAVMDLKTEPGKGVIGKVKRGNKTETICVGNLVWLLENGYDSTKVPQDLTWEAEGTSDTALWVGSDQAFLGIIFLTDRLRSESRGVVQALVDEGYEVGMITGDAENVAKAIAKDLKLKFFHAGVLPQEKATLVERLSKSKKKGFDMIPQAVCFVGDGINDAPALSRAQLGIAMGSSAEISQTAAGIVLVSNEIARVQDVFKVLNDTRSLITQNLILSFGYNVLMIPLAAGVLYPQFGILLNPSLAAIAMAVSSITVLLNSARAISR